MGKSPFTLMKQVEAQINGVLMAIDVPSRNSAEQKVIASLKRELVDARLDIRDYELSETRTEQLDNAKVGKQRLELLRKLILTASEHGIFGAVDVAQLTAQLDQVAENVY